MDIVDTESKGCMFHCWSITLTLPRLILTNRYTRVYIDLWEVHVDSLSSKIQQYIPSCIYFLHRLRMSGLGQRAMLG